MNDSVTPPVPNKTPIMRDELPVARAATPSPHSAKNRHHCPSLVTEWGL
jgi:hypothetical protein